MRVYCAQCGAPVDIADDTPRGTPLTCGRCGYSAPYVPPAPPMAQPAATIPSNAAQPMKAKSSGTGWKIVLAVVGICLLGGIAVAAPWAAMVAALGLFIWGGLLLAGKARAERPKRTALWVLAAGGFILLFGMAGFASKNAPGADASSSEPPVQAAAARKKAALEQKAARERTAAARTKALQQWQAAWQQAEKALVEDGDLQPAKQLEDTYPNQAELDRLCKLAPDSCETFRKETIQPIQDRAEALVTYAERADAAMDEAKDTLDQKGNVWLKWQAWHAWRSQIQEPSHCPDVVCTRKRRRQLSLADRKMAHLEREAHQALQKMACDARQRIADSLDKAALQDGIEGEVRLEGAQCDRLVWHTALCGRVLLDKTFGDSDALAGYEKKGFSWVGCTSYFGRHGYDLDPPPLEQQEVIDAAALLGK